MNNFNNYSLFKTLSLSKDNPKASFNLFAYPLPVIWLLLGAATIILEDGLNSSNNLAIAVVLPDPETPSIKIIFLVLAGYPLLFLII